MVFHICEFLGEFSFSLILELESIVFHFVLSTVPGGELYRQIRFISRLAQLLLVQRSFDSLVFAEFQFVHGDIKWFLLIKKNSTCPNLSIIELERILSDEYSL